MELYSVLLEEDVAVDARKLGGDVAKILGVTLVEARMIIRKGRGIFMEDLSEEDAAKITELLKNEGVPARSVSAMELPPLPQPRRVAEMERTDEALQVRIAQSDERESVPWDTIGMISVGAVALPGYEEMFSNLNFDQLPGFHTMEDAGTRELLRENLILKLDAPLDEVEMGEFRSGAFEEIGKEWAEQIRVYGDILTKEADNWMRIAMDEFAYVRTEGSVKLGEAWGFASLVEDLHANTENAFSAMAVQLGSRKDIKPLVFPSFEEFNRYSTWLFLRRES